MKAELKADLTILKGIGAKKSQLLQKMGIFCVEDALYSFPREYEDRRNIKKISEIFPDETCMVVAEVKKVVNGRYIRGKKRTTRLKVGDETGEMEILFFNAAYLEKKFQTGQKYWFFGKVAISANKPTMAHPIFGDADEESSDKKILPVYALTAGLTQKDRRKVAENSLLYVDDSMECLRADTRELYKLCGIEYALNNIHFPVDGHKMRAAKYRLIFEELLYFAMGLTMMKNRFLHKESSHVMSGTHFEDEFCRSLPYELTKGQKDTIKEICADMESGKRMNRLIQGDVGSGKTVVGAAAIYKTVMNGYQAVLMAPTEILANQHYETFKELFKDKGIGIELLTSSVSPKNRREIIERLSSGESKVLIGTHAVFGKDVEFSNLALVITDEQHRFGVSQREALNMKGTEPHVIVMTATPIPRTLALILYGDMDVSVIRDKPAGRKEIITKSWSGDEREIVYGFVKKEIQKGRQAYIVTPLIEASENMDAKSSEEVYAEVSEFFKPFETELLHGRMKQSEKDSVMQRFKDGEIKVLVSTVIIEVGINVPNASVMVIENSERFGLAQMHQLRGRVGRGSEQSYCMLILDSKNDVAIQRAEAMEECSDGLIIAEKDLQLRGTGEFFGVRQHGIPDMRIADIVRHSKILKQALAEAARIMQDDALLENEENIKMRERIFELYGDLNPGL